MFDDLPPEQIWVYSLDQILIKILNFFCYSVRTANSTISLSVFDTNFAVWCFTYCIKVGDDTTFVKEEEHSFYTIFFAIQSTEVVVSCVLAIVGVLVISDVPLLWMVLPFVVPWRKDSIPWTLALSLTWSELCIGNWLG